ncbi:MAG: high-affinity Fe2+/Pb2+ permease [Candidatus Fonsibacter ubiquis]|nr:high-affinity Fe2+/Pb2+ permease [Candidatus Fonsibacter ubiquis]
MYESLAPYLSSFFILFREGFEALLIAILVFTYLDKVNARHQRPAVMWGLVAGVVASLILALAVKQIAAVTHAHEEIFEGSVMLIASGMLAYVAYFSHNAKKHIYSTVPVIAGAATGTFALIFVYLGLKKITKILPIGVFFRVSSILLLMLSIYFGYEGTKELYAGLRELKII